MRVTVTGAAGFLGNAVTAELLGRGHEVVALVRSGSDSGLSWAPRVRIVTDDLRRPASLPDSLSGSDAVVHAAAATSGSLQDQLESTVMGTENLLRGMSEARVPRLVLISSYAVYDYSSGRPLLHEHSQLEREISEREPYAVAKYYQERLARSFCARHGVDLTVLRPSHIWGKPGWYPARAGRSVKGIHLVWGVGSILPLTHVANCAHLVVTATEDMRAIGETFNVIDREQVTAWRFVGEFVRRTALPGHRVAVPYFALSAAVSSLYALLSVALRGKPTLPDLLTPRYLAPGYRPRHFAPTRAQELLGWEPPLDLESCLALTFGPMDRSTGDGRRRSAAG